MVLIQKNAGSHSHLTNSNEKPGLCNYGTFAERCFLIKSPTLSAHWMKGMLSCVMLGSDPDEGLGAQLLMTCIYPSIPLLLGPLTRTDHRSKHRHIYPSPWEHYPPMIILSSSSLVSYLLYNKSTSFSILSAKRQRLKCCKIKLCTN